MALPHPHGTKSAFVHFDMLSEHAKAFIHQKSKKTKTLHHSVKQINKKAISDQIAETQLAIQPTFGDFRQK